jgi:hypothetical protein
MKPKPKQTQPIDIPQMPFDDALRKILKAPHQLPAKRKKSKRALSKRTK